MAEAKIFRSTYIPGKKKPHKLKAGTKVKVRGKIRILSIPIYDIAGGWVLNQPVEGFKCWNEKDMTVIELPKEKK